MKKQTKWPRLTQRVTRTTQLAHPVGDYLDACAVQRNDIARNLLHKNRWIPYADKPQMLLALSALARSCGLSL